VQTVKLIIIGVLGLCVAFLLVFIFKSIHAPKKKEGIEKLIKQGKISAAIKLAKNIIAKDPRDFKAHNLLGKAYLEDNKPELALMEFKIVNQNALFNNPIEEREFRTNIATLYKKFNQPEEALKEYLLLTKLEPTNAENFYNAARLFESRNNSGQALKYYQKTVSLNKKHAKAHAGIGLLLFQAKQYNEAKKAIDLSIQLSPDTYFSYYYLGKIYKETKDYAAAVNAFEKALRDPEFKQKALIERGSCYVAANNIDKAIFEYDRAIKSTPDESSQETLYARYFLAACYEKKRNIDAAISQWEKIYAKNHNFRDVSAKLIEYRSIQSNDNMKEYLTAGSEQFLEICKTIARDGLNLTLTNAESTKFGCKCMATENKTKDWMNVRQQVFVVLFFRDNQNIEDSILRKMIEEMKKQNITKCIICTSSGFTRQALEFAENRPIELLNKDKLEEILSKITL